MEHVTYRIVRDGSVKLGDVVNFPSGKSELAARMIGKSVAALSAERQVKVWRLTKEKLSSGRPVGVPDKYTVLGCLLAHGSPMGIAEISDRCFSGGIEHAGRTVAALEELRGGGHVVDSDNGCYWEVVVGKGAVGV